MKETKMKDKVMSNNRIERLNQLISMLDEANHLQQELFGESHPNDCLQYHNQLSETIDSLYDILADLEYINSNDVRSD